jgi:hypothetical protein
VSSTNLSGDFTPASQVRLARLERRFGEIGLGSCNCGKVLLNAGKIGHDYFQSFQDALLKKASRIVASQQRSRPAEPRVTNLNVPYQFSISSVSKKGFLVLPTHQ